MGRTCWRVLDTDDPRKFLTARVMRKSCTDQKGL